MSWISSRRKSVKLVLIKVPVRRLGHRRRTSRHWTPDCEGSRSRLGRCSNFWSTAVVPTTFRSANTSSTLFSGPARSLEHRRITRRGLRRCSSAMLSAIALLGVVGSLLYQARQNRTQQQQFVRSLQFDLFRMSLEDPSLRHAWGGFNMSLSPQEWRLHSFASMRLIYLRMGFDHGDFSEPDVQGGGYAHSLRVKEEFSSENR